MVAASVALGWASINVAIVLITVLCALGCAAWVLGAPKVRGVPNWHALLEGRALLFTVLTLLAVMVGGVAELVPTIAISRAVPSHGEAQQRYTALELEGRDLYVREGCYNCHSQNIRPFRWETQRYGAPSRAEEFIYDHPFQWGSKRTGPDLARQGGKYPHLWHYTHLVDPRAVSAGSNMPAFQWLVTARLAVRETGKKLALMQKLGVPYTNADVDHAAEDLRAQAEEIAAELAKQGAPNVAWNSEMVAMIAYLQRLGRPPARPMRKARDAPVTASALDLLKGAP
jgi:cytochrome c oxidase cbb3-type subunit I/II